MKNWSTQLELPVNWGDMDAFNHVNNIIYLRWCESARIALFQQLWGKVAVNMVDIMNSDGIGPILANFTIDYKNPVSYPNTVVIKTRISTIGNSSFGVEHEIYTRKNPELLVAQATSVIVMLNYKDGTKFKLTENQKERLKAFA